MDQANGKPRSALEQLQNHDITAPFNFAEQEKLVIQYHRDIDAFQESLRQSKGRKPYTFFDGPPFATGKPHYVRILS